MLFAECIGRDAAGWCEIENGKRFYVCISGTFSDGLVAGVFSSITHINEIVIRFVLIGVIFG